MSAKIVVGITGASGAIYARATIEALRSLDGVEIAAVISRSAPEVWAHELGESSGTIEEWLAARSVPVFRGRDYAAPFASGSARWGAMVIVPCSMSALARIAHGISDDLLTRAADVILKERRRLILVARETPLSTIHLENMLAVARAGAVVMPATPSFYGRPADVDAVVATVVARIVDHLGLASDLSPRWGAGAVLRRTS
jgi:4-hydroxy-3-polyprenylbenzoate decarboxylase